MVFKNEEELKRFLLHKCRNALAKSQEKVYEIVDKFLNDFYADYTPSPTYVDWDGKVKSKTYYYQRTYQLLHSLVKAEVVPTGNGYEARVYFDYSSLSYPDGNQPSGAEVMAAAAQGLHGAIGSNFQYVSGNSGVGIWNDPIRELDAKAIGILKSMLIAEGIPIK